MCANLTRNLKVPLDRGGLGPSEATPSRRPGRVTGRLGLAGRLGRPSPGGLGCRRQLEVVTRKISGYALQVLMGSGGSRRARVGCSGCRRPWARSELSRAADCRQGRTGSGAPGGRRGAQAGESARAQRLTGQGGLHGNWPAPVPSSILLPQARPFRSLVCGTRGEGPRQEPERLGRAHAADTGPKLRAQARCPTLRPKPPCPKPRRCANAAPRLRGKIAPPAGLGPSSPTG